MIESYDRALYSYRSRNIDILIYRSITCLCANFRSAFIEVSNWPQWLHESMRSEHGVHSHWPVVASVLSALRLLVLPSCSAFALWRRKKKKNPHQTEWAKRTKLTLGYEISLLMSWSFESSVLEEGGLEREVGKWLSRTQLGQLRYTGNKTHARRTSKNNCRLNC